VRKPPRTTPPLAQGVAAPQLAFDVVANATQNAFTVRAHFSYDRYRDELSYRLVIDGASSARVHAVVLQRGTAAQAGPVVHRLSGVGVARAEGVIRLTAAERAQLLDGQWSLVAYVDGAPAARAPLSSSTTLRP
jgi:hypothetical protein